MNILILAEFADGKLKKYSMELAGKALSLSKVSGGTVSALVIGKGAEGPAKELGHFGVTKCYVASGEAFGRYSGEAYAKAICAAVESEKPAAVLATASSLGKDAMARASMRLGAGLATDCTSAECEGGKLRLKRPIFAGKAIIDVDVTGSIVMATLRPNSFPVPAPASADAAITALAVDAGGARAKVIDEVMAEANMLDLTEADRIISGGRAIGSKENFAMIKELADVLGASVGASRAAVDAGFISHDHQVGQTGKTVNPTLYIACGISGSIQHMAGMRTSKVIVAINKDPEAPIFSKADYGIVGDLFKVVPAMTQAAKKLLRE